MLNFSEKALPKEPPRPSDGDVHTRITNQLQTYYNQILTQPLPDRFQDLLRRLADEEPSATEGERGE
ncbi:MULTISPECIES: NepR family anti-sigma factor [unclassified Stappia]|uniref:NepR family anti-sigma factor n=1 Tax=unclassified Stappia TaxID=2629676 RepID=UPI001643CDD4|nr:MULTISPECIES: NepR family anti-sigma factor [unclassified Stappia]